MRKVIKLVIILSVVFIIGCNSGGNVILDKAAINKAKTKINDLAKIVGAYKRLRNELPAEDKPLFESLEGFITEKKMAEFVPTVENIYNQYLEKLISEKIEEIPNKKLSEIAEEAKNDEEMQEKYYQQLLEQNQEIYEGAVPEKLKTELKDEAQLKVIEHYKREEALSLITDKEKEELMNEAKNLYRRKLPPFNTNPDDGGWKKPKWVIIEPKRELIVEERVQRFKDNYGREPRGFRLNRIKEQADAFVKSQRTGYVIWMANDSNNTLVYAKVQ